jgi:hypothetical protein
MKRNNSEILSKVRTVVSGNKKEEPKSGEIVQNELLLNKEINKWIEINAEKIAKEIIEKEVKKIFK